MLHRPRRWLLLGALALITITALLSIGDTIYDWFAEYANFHHETGSTKKIDVKTTSDSPINPTIHLTMTACQGPLILDMLLASLKSFLSLTESPVMLHLLLDQKLRPQVLDHLTQLQHLADFEYTLYDAVYPTAALQLSMQRMYRNCATLRLFLPELLPDVDSVLYVDVDTVFMAPADQLWKQLSHMNSSQMIAMADNKLKPDFRHVQRPDFALFAKSPRLERLVNPFDWKPVLEAARSPDTRSPKFNFTRFPDGLNTGVMLLNLTRMRAVGWSEQIQLMTTKFQRYMGLPVQRVINVLILLHPEWLHRFDCRDNVYSVYYRLGLMTCISAASLGPRVIHGTGENFAERKPFHGLFKAWRLFDMSSEHIDKVIQRSNDITVMLPRDILDKLLPNYSVFMKSLMRFRHVCGRRKKHFCT